MEVLKGYTHPELVLQKMVQDENLLAEYTMEVSIQLNFNFFFNLNFFHDMLQTYIENIFRLENHMHYLKGQLANILIY